MMHGRGKSDFAIVAVNPANKVARPAAEQSVAGPTAAELVEPRRRPRGCGPAKHAPDSESGKRVTGAGTHTASNCRCDPR